MKVLDNRDYFTKSIQLNQLLKEHSYLRRLQNELNDIAPNGSKPTDTRTTIIMSQIVENLKYVSNGLREIRDEYEDQLPGSSGNVGCKRNG